MKIAIVSAWYNEELLAPYFLNHYDFVDEIHIILDTATTDKTRGILEKDKRVIIHEMTYPPDGLDWLMKQEKVEDVYKTLDADWVFAVDADEFLYKHREPDIRKFLARQKGDVLWTRLWQIYRHESEANLDPKLKPLFQRTHGIRAEALPREKPTMEKAYLKPIVIRGGKEPKWDCGCHSYDGSLVESTERMDGVHWHMADVEIALRRRLQTKARQGKRNIQWGMGTQNHTITEGEIRLECWLNRTLPQVVFPYTQTDDMVSIVIPVWNQLEYTMQCVESLDAFTPEKHEVIFVDNGSADDTNRWLKEQLLTHPNWKLVENKINHGFVTACNQGAAIAKGEYLLFLNNDCVVSRGWLKGLLDCINSAGDIGCVGPRTNSISGPQVVKSDSGSYDSMLKYTAFAESYRKSYRGLYIPYWRIVGFCMLTRKSLFDRLGGFDEIYSPGNFEDDDYCMKVVHTGLRNLICGDVFIHHHGSKSHNMATYNELLLKNKSVFDKKWEARDTISAVMIVKDEEDTLADCLTNLTTQVDEIVVVDTGSTDDTKKIAKNYPIVKLYDFPWNDDFSEARNFANSKATMAWILSVDADEIVTGLDKVELKPFHAYMVETRNYTNNPRWADAHENCGEYPEEKGKRWFGSIKVRLWPNDPRIKFEYPVHEVVENSIYYLGMGIIKDKDFVVHHYGRLDDNYEYGKGDKYYALLHKQFESGVNDLRSLEQLALQAQGMKKFAEARTFWQEILKLEPDNKAAYFNMGHCFAEEGKWEEALSYTKKAKELNPDSKDVTMNLATCEAMVGNLDTAETICRDLIDKYPLYPLSQGLLNAIEIRKQEGIQNG